ncbi:HSP31, partial [Symbiodinium sp. CCMP2456]
MAGFGILCCREVSHGSKEHISDAKRRKEKERRARRKEGKQRERGDDRRHQRHPKDVEDLGRVKGAPDEVEMEHNADFLRRRSSSRLLDDDSEYSGESARSGLSRASSFASSYASYVSTQSAEPRRRRSQGSRRGSKGREGPAEAAPSTVKVLNLADLRGRELPAKLEDLQKVPMDPAIARTSVKNGAAAANGSSSNRQPAKPSPPPVEVPPREEQEEVQAPLSARSGRSEGAGSVKSVASTSIQRYSDQLSGPKKSSAEIKKMVKEFVREMVKGKEMNVLRVDGSLMEVKCGLTRTLDALKIKSGGETRNLRLGDVEK